MSNEREQLILKLKEFQKNKFSVEKVQEAWECTPVLLTYIGDTDQELRDELIYMY